MIGTGIFEDLTFPLSEDDIQKQIQNIAERPLVIPPRPRQPIFGPSASTPFKIVGIQRFIESFEYNYTGINFFDITGVKNNQSLQRVLDTARKIVKDALPIKCVEAVYIGMLLTKDMVEVDRVPVVFKSRIGGHSYGHIVLVLRWQNKFGALGLSRRSDLMYKPMEYDSFVDLMHDFKSSYEKWRHKLLRIKVGLPIPHSYVGVMQEPVVWKNETFQVEGEAWEDVAHDLNKYLRECWRLVESWVRGSGLRAVQAKRKQNSVPVVARAVPLSPAKGNKKKNKKTTSEEASNDSALAAESECTPATVDDSAADSSQSSDDDVEPQPSLVRPGFWESSVEPARLWTEDRVAEWLASLDLGFELPAFGAMNGRSLLALNGEDLRRLHLDVSACSTLLAAISDLPDEPEPPRAPSSRRSSRPASARPSFLAV